MQLGIIIIIICDMNIDIHGMTRANSLYYYYLL